MPYLLLLLLLLSGCHSHSDSEHIRRLYIQQQNYVSDSELPSGLIVKYKLFALYDDLSIKDVTDKAEWSSSNTQVMSIDVSGHLASARLLNKGEADVTSSYHGISAPPIHQVVSSASLVDIVVDSPPSHNSAIGVNGKKHFEAKGIYSDSSEIAMNEMVVWKSSNEAVARFEGNILTAIKVGETDISAEYNGYKSNVVTQPIIEDKLVSIFLTVNNKKSSSVSIPVGKSVSLTAFGNFENTGVRELYDSDFLNWSTSDQNALIVTSDGGVLAKSPKSENAQVYASSRGVQSTPLEVSVTDATISSINIKNIPDSLPVGININLIAEGHYSDGSQNILENAHWEVSDDDKASINEDTGILVGKKAGSILVTVGKDGVIKKESLDIVDSEFLSWEIQPKFNEDSVFVKGDNVSFEGSATYTDGNHTIDSNNIIWEFSNCTDSAIDNGNVYISRIPNYGLDNCAVTATYNGITRIKKFTAMAPLQKLNLGSLNSDFFGWKSIRLNTEDGDGENFVVGIYGSYYGPALVDFNDIRNNFVQHFSALDSTDSFRIEVMDNDELKEIYLSLNQSFESFVDIICEGNFLCSGSDLDEVGVWSRTEVTEDKYYVQPGDKEELIDSNHYLLVKLKKEKI